jgi:hypothetical protein
MIFVSLFRIPGAVWCCDVLVSQAVSLPGTRHRMLVKIRVRLFGRNRIWQWIANAGTAESQHQTHEHEH